MGPVASLNIRTQLLLQCPRVVPRWTLSYYTLVSALVCQAGPRQSQQAVTGAPRVRRAPGQAMQSTRSVPEIFKQMHFKNVRRILCTRN